MEALMAFFALLSTPAAVARPVPSHKAFAAR
jgi:hypothetical protein